ncbi:MAG: GAF domain-containing protein [Jaaginema sp. PMC 1079.18]|nr:GAF domain-containing protein [Jaaginema sp. PMC 1080.18]MEC4849896.1 GAF domain-containing protein [Jaaginema sp. PMC 1079.18]
MANQQQWQNIVQQIQTQFNAETAVLAKAEAQNTIIHYIAAVGKHAAAIVGKRGEMATSGLCGIAMQSNCPILSTETVGDTRLRQDYVKSLGIYTALAVPLYTQDQLCGAIMVLNRLDGSNFDQFSEQQLVKYAEEISPAIADWVEATHSQ